MAKDVDDFYFTFTTPPDAILVYSDSKIYPAVSIIAKDKYDSSGYRIANSDTTNLEVEIFESTDNSMQVRYYYRSSSATIKYKLIYF